MEVTVSVQLDAALFQAFARFDTLIHQKRWRRPAGFSLILLVSALLCFAQTSRQGASLLGGVLIAVAVIVPAGYFLSFFLSIRRQAARMGLTRLTPVYTLTLNPGGISVAYAGGRQKPERIAWSSVYRVCFRKNAVYLYVSPKKAFLLPNSQMEPDCDTLKALCQKQLGQGRISGT